LQSLQHMQAAQLAAHGGVAPSGGFHAAAVLAQQREQVAAALKHAGFALITAQARSQEATRVAAAAVAADSAAAAGALAGLLGQARLVPLLEGGGARPAPVSLAPSGLERGFLLLTAESERLGAAVRRCLALGPAAGGGATAAAADGAAAAAVVRPAAALAALDRLLAVTAPLLAAARDCLVAAAAIACEEAGGAGETGRTAATTTATGRTATATTARPRCTRSNCGGRTAPGRN
jgi:hypothetical protein